VERWKGGKVKQGNSKYSFIAAFLWALRYHYAPITDQVRNDSVMAACFRQRTCGKNHCTRDLSISPSVYPVPIFLFVDFFSAFFRFSWWLTKQFGRPASRPYEAIFSAFLCITPLFSVLKGKLYNCLRFLKQNLRSDAGSASRINNSIGMLYYNAFRFSTFQPSNLPTLEPLNL